MKMRIVVRFLLFVLLLSAFAEAQSNTTETKTISFPLHHGSTVWDIWNNHGTSDWITFYEAVTELNPQYATNRFRSVPTGAEIEIPSTLIDVVVSSAANPFVGVAQSSVEVLPRAQTPTSSDFAVLLQANTDSMNRVSTAIQTLSSKAVQENPVRWWNSSLLLMLLFAVVILLCAAIIVITLFMWRSEISSLRHSMTDLRGWIFDLQDRLRASEIGKLDKDNQMLIRENGSLEQTLNEVRSKLERTEKIERRLRSDLQDCYKRAKDLEDQSSEKLIDSDNGTSSLAQTVTAEDKTEGVTEADLLDEETLTKKSTRRGTRGGGRKVTKKKDTD